MPCRFFLSVACLCVGLSPLFFPELRADEAPKYRTDDGADQSLPWYTLVDEEFPPPNSAHAISGELIKVDHLERRFQIRVDRDDSQQAGFLDLPIDGVLLPYASIDYHGAPAALQDVPLGTHLHGLFYLKAADDKAAPPAGAHGRVTREAAFTRCFHLEDDFSHYTRRKETWKIDAVDLAKRKLTATLQRDGKGVGAAKGFDLLGSTRVLEGTGFGKLESLQAGQTVQLNLTWATLYGPGRVTEVWIDEASRELAAAQQRARHHDHVRERGLPGRIETVDDEAQIVTITFFDSVDPKLFDELTGINEEPHSWPFSKPEDNPKAPKGGIAVSRECLMTYDPVNDRKGGNILAIDKIPVEPGSSGVQIKVKCCILLEGFRPGRTVRFYPATWKVDALPREEQFHGLE